MAAHACETCGLLHDMPEAAGESEAVMLARIEAEARTEIARIEAGAQRAEARAMVDSAHEYARGEADAAEAEAEIIGDAIEAAASPDSNVDPVEIIAPEVTEEPEPEPDDAPPENEGSSEPTVPRKRSLGLGAW